MSIIQKLFRFLFAVSLVLITIACSSIDQDIPTSAQDAYDKGMKYYNDEDYLEAKRLFEVIKLQYPASEYADDAQFHVSQIYYNREEYIYAAYNFNQLRKTYPNSPFVKNALYNGAMCYYELSPTYDRDQEYTQKAIKAFMEFQYLYPKDSLYNEASAKLTELREKLAEREFFTAELYLKLSSPKSAIIYFDQVIENYEDTSFYERDYVGKVKALVQMKRYDEANGLVDLYRKMFTSGQMRGDIQKIELELKELMQES